MKNPNDLKSVSNIILSYCLDYLDTRYLTDFRLVCKLWNRRVSPIVFKHLNLIPYSDTAFWRRYRLPYFSPSEIYISTLIKTLSNYIRYTESLTISRRFTPNLPTYLLDHFHFVTSIQLNNATIFFTVFSNLTHTLSTLKELVIKNVILEMDSEWEQFPKPLFPNSLKVLNINTFHDYFDFPNDLWFTKNCVESLVISNNAQSILIPFYHQIPSFKQFIWKRRFEVSGMNPFGSAIDCNPQLSTISLRYHTVLISTLDSVVSRQPETKEIIRLDQIKLFTNFHFPLETPVYFEFGNCINLTEFKLCFTPMISLLSIHSLLMGCKKLTTLVLYLDEITQVEVDLIAMNCPNLKLLSLGANKFQSNEFFEKSFQCKNSLEQLYLDNLEFDIHLVEFIDQFINLNYFSIFNQIERDFEEILDLRELYKGIEWSLHGKWSFEFSYGFSCISFNPLNSPKHYNYYTNTINDLYL